MRTKSFDGMACSVAGALEQVGDKWAILILRDLQLGLGRFEQFEASLGISTNTLTNRLKHLEKNGLVERYPYRDRPVRHAYRLTRKGRDFGVVLAALLQWGDSWDVSGRGVPPMRLVDEHGDAVELRLVSTRTGETVRRTRPSPGPGADAKARWRLGESGRG